MIRIYFFSVPPFQGPLWFVCLFVSVLSSLGHHTGEGNKKELVNWEESLLLCCLGWDGQRTWSARSSQALASTSLFSRCIEGLFPG